MAHITKPTSLNLASEHLSVRAFPELYTPREIASHLKVSPKSIYYWVARNEIPYLRVGRHLRFQLKDVLESLTQKTEEAKPTCFQKPLGIERKKSTWSLTTRKSGHSHQTKE